MIIVQIIVSYKFFLPIIIGNRGFSIVYENKKYRKYVRSDRNTKNIKAKVLYVEADCWIK